MHRRQFRDPRQRQPPRSDRTQRLHHAGLLHEADRASEEAVEPGVDSRPSMTSWPGLSRPSTCSSKTWMPGTIPGMTDKGSRPSLIRQLRFERRLEFAVDQDEGNGARRVGAIAPRMRGADLHDDIAG